MLEISQKIKVQYWIMALYVFVAKSLYKLIQIASGGSCRLHRPTITSKCCSPNIMKYVGFYKMLQKIGLR